MTEERSRTWHAVDVVADPAAAEALEHAFNLLESLGTEIDQMPASGCETVTVVGYFDESPDEELLQTEIGNALSIYGLEEIAIKTVSMREVEDQDWLAEWKKHWKPTAVGNFVIAPPWETVSDPSRIAIYIEPNMAFGTGTHATTQLCLSAIENDLSAGESFFDVGTGTGILAIAAAKINQRLDGIWLPNLENCPEIAACDIDTQAVELARANTMLNGVGDNISFFDGPLTDFTEDFDFVCANLTLDVILEILPVLLAKARKQLVLSGILAEQETAILSQLQKMGVTDPAVARSGEWIAVSVSIEKP